MRTHSHKCQVALLIRSVRPGLLWAPLLLPCQPCFPSPHRPGQSPIPPSPKPAGGCLGGLVLPGRPLHSPHLAPERQRWALRGLCGASHLSPPSSRPTGRIDAGMGREEARQPSNWSPRPTGHGRRRIPGAGGVEGRCHCWWGGASVPPGDQESGSAALLRGRLCPESVLQSALRGGWEPGAGWRLEQSGTPEM